MKKDEIIKKNEIWQAIKASDEWLERAIIAIYENQDPDEQRNKESNTRNGIGFNKYDAVYLTWIAEYIKSGKHLSGKHKEKARKRIKKYCGQLVDLANQNQGDEQCQQ